MAKNALVLDIKPKNEIVLDPKPKNKLVSTEIDRLYEQVLTAGMYMGIPPHTYPTAGTVTTRFSP